MIINCYQDDKRYRCVTCGCLVCNKFSLLLSIALIMYVRTSILLQSLLLSMPQRDDSSSSSESLENNFYDSDSYQMSVPKKLTPIPDPKDAATMSRFVVHQANWTSVAYISHQKGSENRALADMFAVSDGPVSSGSGVPYFYVSRLEAAITDLLDNNNQCSLTMGLAQTSLCKERDWDDEDPRCAHVVLTGTFQKVDLKSKEFLVARNALFTRHPSFKNLPVNHHFFIGKLAIDSISVQDFFGGPVQVNVADYFAVKNKSFGLASKIRPIYDYSVIES